MKIGNITIDGRSVGVVSFTYSLSADQFTPNLEGYEPEGRASDGALGDSGDGRTGRHGGGSHHHGGHQPGHHDGARIATKEKHHHYPGHHQSERAPSGKDYPATGGRSVSRGSASTEKAIEDAAKANNLDPNFMKSTASIESSMNPASNADKATQYKGLYQIGRNEWERFGQGNIYDARDNAMAAGQMFSENRRQFHNKFGRDPTDTEMYLMHQQGLGFYTRGAMTNIGGNRYPGMSGPQTHDSFEAGWGREVSRRKDAFQNGTAPSAPSAAGATGTAINPATQPGAVKSPSGDPAAFIMHHTGGRGTPQGVQNTLNQRGLGVQYIMDREGHITEAGGHSHMMTGWGEKGSGLSNRNTVGMEVIAKDDKDVTPAQVESAKAFIAKNYPSTPVFGHGEVNPGHKEADEGMTIVNAIRGERAHPAKPEKSASADKSFDPETMVP